MLVILGLLWMVSFVDRFILALLVAPLKADLHLNDVQLGLLFGTFFAVFYALMGIPLARLADNHNRKRLIIAGVVFWSLCTIGSAFATNYATLALLRIGLATGEAALTPAAFSLLTDAFPPRRRMIAGTLLSAMGMMGASIAFIAGAGVIAWAEQAQASMGMSAWRLALMIVGMPGIALTVAFAFIAREPSRSELEAKVSMGDVFRFLRKERALYGGLFAGAGAAQLISYALIAWSAAHLSRSFGLASAEAGSWLGLSQFVSAVGGTIIVPFVIRIVAARNITVASLLPATGVIAAGILVVLSTISGNAHSFLILSTMGAFLLVGITNAILVLIQSTVPGSMRATVTSLLLICVSGIGLGLGPALVPMLGRIFPQAYGELSAGLMGVAFVGCAIGTGAFFVAARSLRREFARLEER
ncbi:hypothetical protein ASE49_10870 [Novosphingobium sp. Leaf2]|nr:hypothetical protein ASE49_10870 [Novosphingobium sp. Leaf2]